MKTTDTFKKTIKTYLDSRAERDNLFAAKYGNEEKNIDDCVTYILNTVQKSGCNGFTDDEVYNMAIHYYDEDNIEIGKAIQAKVVVNHSVELTEEDKAEAKQQAIERVMQEQVKALKKPIKKQKEDVQQLSMF